MSGIISPFSRSGVLRDVRGLTLRAYCRITSNTPSSSAFDRSFNVASISYSSSALQVNFIDRIVSPYSLSNLYSLSTGSYVRFVTSTTLSGSQPGISLNYRVMNNNGSIATTNGDLGGLCVAIYGGIGS